MTHTYYILDVCRRLAMQATLEEYVAWRKTNDPTMRRTEVGDTVVSTVFTGVCTDPDVLYLYETIIFKPDVTQFVGKHRRYMKAVNFHVDTCKSLFGNDYAQRLLPDVEIIEQIA